MKKKKRNEEDEEKGRNLMAIVYYLHKMNIQDLMDSFSEK